MFYVVNSTSGLGDSIRGVARNLVKGGGALLWKMN